MSLLSKIFSRKKTIDDYSVEELREMEIRLNHKIEALLREAGAIEKEIQALFEKAKKAKSRSEEVSIANRIKTLSHKKNAKLNAQAQLEKELRAVSNLLVLKEHESDLRQAGVWDDLRKLSPQEVESYLIRKRLEAEDRDQLIGSVIEMTSQAMAQGAEIDEELEDILSTIRAVKKGELEPEQAERVVSGEAKEAEGRE